MRPSKDHKVLLILDGHKSHTHNLKALELATESGVIMVSLPPHTSHRMQPLDVSFFKPLKTFYYQHIEQWMRAHPGRAVTALQISRLFGLAYGKAATVSNAVNGFKVTGICPFNPLIFPDHVYSPSDVTDIPLSSSVEQAGIAAKDVDSANDELIKPVGLVLPATTLHLGSDHEIGSSSASTNPLTTGKSPPKQNAFASEAAPVPSPQLLIGITSISPLPKLVQSEGRKRRSTSKSTILTSSPHKRSLRTLATENATSKPKGKKGGQKKKPKQSVVATNQSSILYHCTVCGESNDEDWIQCLRCKDWTQEACANISNEKYYYCDSCQ